ncbi:MAG: dihydrodipicolinate synthase family protein [Chitinophagaceae bacterium]|nr:dihydrodipicolinate synthase family protein [Chitinophagaceae bacterium]
MHADGTLNSIIIPEYYALLKGNGVTGAFINGSTGEGVSLTLAEKKEVIDAWASCTKADAGFKVMTLLGGTCIADCKELAVHAKKAGLYAVSFTAPNYFKPADVRMLAQCCAEIAAAVPGMPFYYYHIPVLTGVHFPMYDLLKEVDGSIPNFAGIKYTHEDFMDYLSCLLFNNKKYDMLWGRDENMLPALSVGAKGAVGSTYNYSAPLYHRLIQAFEHGKPEEAAQLQEQSVEMIRLLGKYGGIATGKAYMKLIGLDCGKFRLPVKNMSDEDFVKFRKDTEAINFSSYSSKISTAVSR